MAGSPEHNPTPETRATVSSLNSFGVKQDDIAKYIGVSGDTLAKHYREELDKSRIQANAAVAAKLFRKATDGDDFNAMRFWLGCQAGWKTADSKAKTDQQKAFNEALLANFKHTKDA